MIDLSKYKDKKVLVAMSGGLDSSMVAVMLKLAGIDVIGITFQLGDTKIRLGNSLDSSCCTIDDINDARSIAVKYNFPYQVVDLKPLFEKNVIGDFADKTIDGLTPNPCVICNKTVKWAGLMKYAEMLDCEFIATGHYAKIVNKDGRFRLSRPKDLTKDQTYFLHYLSQSDLAKTIFPLGDMLKTEVRDFALSLGINTFVDKAESFDICFVGDSSYKDFMLTKFPQLKALDGGDIVLTDGKIVGKHSGYVFYTVGQRKGLGISLGYPVYVLKIDSANNKLVVGPKEELSTNTIKIGDIDINALNDLSFEKEYLIRVRSMDKGTMGVVSICDDGLEIKLLGEIKGGVAPGQSCVIYDENDVICSGFILKRI